MAPVPRYSLPSNLFFCFALLGTVRSNHGDFHRVSTLGKRTVSRESHLQQFSYNRPPQLGVERTKLKISSTGGACWTPLENVWWREEFWTQLVMIPINAASELPEPAAGRPTGTSLKIAKNATMTTTLTTTTPVTFVARGYPSAERHQESCHGGDSEDSGNPAATAATSVQLGASQDKPTVLDDDQSVDIPDAAASDDEKPTFEVTDPITHRGLSPSLTLSGGFAEPDTEDGKDTSDSLAKYNTRDPVRDEKGGSNKSHKDNAFHTCTLTRGNGGNERSESGIGSDAPASIGQIHDVFAEFEETFGMARRKQNTVTTLRDCPDRDVTARSIPRPVRAAVDGAADMEQLAEAVSGDVGCNYLSKEEIENGTTFQSRQESDGQKTQTEDISPSVFPHRLATVARVSSISALLSLILVLTCSITESTSTVTGPPPSTPSMVTHQATRPDASADTQGAPNRKRIRPCTQPAVLSDDNATRKRRHCATKETWKARETREAQEKFEAKLSQTLLNPYRKKQTHFHWP
ncbi:uncharacterized protein Z518_07293 [Rhinocladiella mackenziei CBS 650.93]|uniref:Uncharacterized protein n=1 Tax=Rhinocladiella mackenziei CBS 650.93 TaxID=1442369 RepID=A0A0D2J415_9EURO|nr:uncharacterized protein Z518_07293 [Rhinocladiella mackenziei CBS 650.93]KIX03740.1 hypothetical protein Z518_07293 [Rhinocladiella mackenziei CBS 650.93]